MTDLPNAPLGECTAVPAENLANLLAKKLAPAAMAPRLAQRLVEVMTDLGAQERQVFDMFLHGAVAVARASNFPLPYGDTLHAAAELVWREARDAH